MDAFGVFKKQICGLNITGPQGVNAKNELIIGQIGGDGNTPLTSEYWYQPAIRLGDKVFTPVGNVKMINDDADFMAELTIPTPPEDGTGKNFVLLCDWDQGEISWVEFPILPEDYDEKNYVLALDSEGVMVWKEEPAPVDAKVPVTFNVCPGMQTNDGDSTNMHLKINGVDFPYNIDNTTSSGDVPPMAMVFMAEEDDVITFTASSEYDYYYNGTKLVAGDNGYSVTIDSDVVNAITVKPSVH